MQEINSSRRIASPSIQSSPNSPFSLIKSLSNIVKRTIGWTDSEERSQLSDFTVSKMDIAPHIEKVKNKLESITDSESRQKLDDWLDEYSKFLNFSILFEKVSLDDFHQSSKVQDIKISLYDGILKASEAFEEAFKGKIHRHLTETNEQIDATISDVVKERTSAIFHQIGNKFIDDFMTDIGNKQEINDGTCKGQSVAIAKYLMSSPNTTFIDFLKIVKTKKDEIIYYQLLVDLKADLFGKMNEAFFQSTYPLFEFKQLVEDGKLACIKDLLRQKSLEEPVNRKIKRSKKTAKIIDAATQHLTFKSIVKNEFPITTRYIQDEFYEQNPARLLKLIEGTMDDCHKVLYHFDVDTKVSKEAHIFSVYIDNETNEFVLYDSNWIGGLVFSDKEILIKAAIDLCAVLYDLISLETIQMPYQGDRSSRPLMN